MIAVLLAACVLLHDSAPVPATQAQAPATVQAAPAEVIVGEGSARYRWVRDWARLPEGGKFGNTHGGIVIDEGGRVLVNTDTDNAVVVFEQSGQFVRAWGKEFRGGTHGMLRHGTGKDERLILAHTSRHEVLGTTFAGAVEWTLGYPKESGIYGAREEYNPTAVALAPDGRLFVADGYGKSWVHVYDKERKYLKSFGGPGSETGKFQTPHGLLLDTQGKTPRLIVADRENHRLQVFDLEGQCLEVVAHDLRRPCGLARFGERYAVADLAGRVTVFDAEFRLLAQLGDQPDESLRAQNGVPPEKFKAGEFISPHAVCFDAAGNLYVMDWVSTGRVTKLEPLPEKQ